MDKRPASQGSPGAFHFGRGMAEEIPSGSAISAKMG